MNTSSNTASTISREVVAWCADYGNFALDLAKWFLILALAVALIETALLLWGKIKALLAKPQDAGADKIADSVDPVTLIKALKDLLETLKGLPAWVAIFLAGLALLWIAGEQPAACKPERPQTEQRDRQKQETPKAPEAPSKAKSAPAG